jgi:hypothetical protein
MNLLQIHLLEITKDMPAYYLKEIIDFAEFIKAKSLRENADTEYLNSIQGMVESIIEASKEDVKNCSQVLDL